MSLDGIDPDILNDFVTESVELIEQLDQDLVALESHPDDRDLLNQIFRALHTIKGSSSFLALDPLTNFAHAAEDALNALRKGEQAVTADTMDMLLRAVDVVRSQLSEIQNDRMPSPGPDELIQGLRRIGSGGNQRDIKREGQDTPQGVDADDKQVDPQALQLSESKLDLLPFMVEDLRDSLNQCGEWIDQLHTDSDIKPTCIQLDDLSEELMRSAEFFEVDTLVSEIGCLQALAKQLPDLAAEHVDQVLPRLAALNQILVMRADALAEQRLITADTACLVDRLTQLAVGQTLSEDAMLDANAGFEQAMMCDGLATLCSDQPQPEATTSDEPAAGEVNTALEASEPAEVGEAEPAAAAQAEAADPSKSKDRTIRVDVDRLESLLNLVGELVLQKNRVLGISRRLNQTKIDQEMTEDLQQVGSDLDRVTSDLQLGVMKTRMQQLNKLFNRYPRVIRDLARATEKQIELKITGGQTEVDKSVLESLGDPLVHILRNSGDHGIEKPDDRIAAGKPAKGTIHLQAQHEGNHVMVKISDDGRGLDPEKIGRKAVEKGVITEDTLSSLSRQDKLNLIFAPGFSTAEQVSDLSGRGVGMDVVRSNINKLNGVVDLSSELGMGTEVSIRIPLTVAIMPAMVVEVKGDQYALPLSNILEIVRPSDEQRSEIGGQPVMRLRDSVLPLLDLATWFETRSTCGALHARENPIAVIIGLGEQRMGVMVEHLIGQQEIVIKPLDGFEKSEAISGATVREDGGVSLILDVAALFKNVQTKVGRAA